MTITYSSKILSILARWKGSVLKLVWKQLVVWLIGWYTVYFILAFALNEEQRKVAIKVVTMFDDFCNGLPLVFILGFYVTQIVNRWWSQTNAVPWPDDVMAVTNSCLFDGDHLKAIRESVARWMALCEAMVLRQISSRIRKRFPKLENLVDAGLMTKQELKIMKKINCKNTRWQMPLDWIIDKVVFPSDIDPIIKVAMVSNINTFRGHMRDLFIYSWIDVPLVYAQTVTVVVYGYFAFAVIGHQYINEAVDLYIPFESILQFLFYFGWMSVANDLMHPFGEHEDNIELNCILDRHAAVAYSMATEVREESPDIVFDENLRNEMAQKLKSGMTHSVTSVKYVKDNPPKLKAYVKLDNEADFTQVQKTQEFRTRNDFFSRLGLRKQTTPLNYF